ncbi:AAC(3) family N-acetyltransferase [Rheinheimera sp.]|uniref:AAC(3) family N-acetyltransferase n=1 Tax=Rheinheimera sp. TaxID=1869214 RepID=UPI00307E803F
MTEHYQYDDLLRAYSNVGVSKGRVVYVTGNFGKPGLYSEKGKQALLNAHLQALMQLLGDTGTLVVPTHSFSLCNTDNVFDSETTPSETGPFTELVRQQAGSVRQFHPFSSSTALGAQAEFICLHNSKHVYGLQSPFQRMLDLDALFVSVGLPARRTASLIHHVEFMMGVPYRYTKEFLHPCRIDNEVEKIIFYLHVLYRDLGLVRDRNKKIFEKFLCQYEVVSSKLGLSFLESFNMREFVDSASRFMAEDIYCWLQQPPTTRPYRL